MNADEIRAVQLEVVTRETEDGPLQYAVDINLRKFEMLREIAAQLAEGNAKPNPMTDLMRDYIDKFVPLLQSMVTPSQVVPVFRAVDPTLSETPQHLGCFVLLPDGTYAMAINGENPGMVPLEMDEAQRLIAVMSKPLKGKPQ